MKKLKKKIKDKYKFCNLYVKNLPNDFTDEKLKELFGKFGEIRSAKVVRKELESHYLIVKKSVKVFGFVCFFEPARAQEAKSKLKETTLTKIICRLSPNKTRKNRIPKIKINKRIRKT